MRGFSHAEGRVIRAGLRIAAVGGWSQRLPSMLNFLGHDDALTKRWLLRWSLRHSFPASGLPVWPRRAHPRAVEQAWVGYVLPTRAERLRPRVDLRGTLALCCAAGRNISHGDPVNRARASARRSLTSFSRDTVQAVVYSRTKRNQASEWIKLPSSLRRVRHDAVARLQQVVDHRVQGATG